MRAISYLVVEYKIYMTKKNMAYNGESHDIIVGDTVGSLTQLQKSLIFGSLLGDGYLRIVPGRKNALLEINHSISEKKYVDWKFKILKSISKSGPKSRKGNGSRVAYRFTTRQHPELTDIYRWFYRADKKKRIPSNLVLDPMSIAVWYMDDGGKCGQDNVYLNTQQFDADDQNLCMRYLENFGIKSSLNRDKIYWRVRIKSDSIEKFFDLVRPYIIPSMEYKLSYNPVETYSEMNGVSRKSDTNMPSPPTSAKLRRVKR